MTGALKNDNWKHRSDTMRCRTCMYFVEKSDLLGRCRRHSPTMKGWPVVYHSDWCGDHKLDADKVEDMPGKCEMCGIELKPNEKYICSVCRLTGLHPVATKLHEEE